MAGSLSRNALHGNRLLRTGCVRHHRTAGPAPPVRSSHQHAVFPCDPTWQRRIIRKMLVSTVAAGRKGDHVDVSDCFSDDSQDVLTDPPTRLTRVTP